RNAMKVWDEGGDFRTLVAADEDIKAHLSPEEIERVFSLDTYLGNVDAIFARVFKERRE
ncbi:MAG: adenylosuccinate lyase, partial [Acidobacteria bacterium]|nr:adenylosuccinate lyase [Acidobacteriota bacterium]